MDDFFVLHPKLTDFRSIDDDDRQHEVTKKKQHIVLKLCIEVVL